MALTFAILVNDAKMKPYNLKCQEYFKREYNESLSGI